MPEPLSDTPLNDIPREPEADKKEEDGTESEIKTDTLGFTAKNIAFKFNTGLRGPDPFKWLEELATLRDNSTLTRDEKNARIKKMLEQE